MSCSARWGAEVDEGGQDALLPHILVVLQMVVDDCLLVLVEFRFLHLD
jgi:hypothetical protein